MIKKEIIARKFEEQSLKERMIEDAFLIISSVDSLHFLVEQKLLEIDEAEKYNNVNQLVLLKSQIRHLLSKLNREIENMDNYMTKYKRLVYEKKDLLSRSSQEESIYLRGVSPNQRRLRECKEISEEIKTSA